MALRLASDLQSSSSTSEVAWLAQGLHKDNSGFVGSVIPAGFPRYVRILHPATRRGRGPRFLRWSEVARRGGGTLGPSTQFLSLALNLPVARGEVPWSSGPNRGSLSSDYLGALVDLLARATADPDTCWFCLWEGYGWALETKEGHRAVQAHELGRAPDTDLLGFPPRVELDGMKYDLYQGEVGDAKVLLKCAHNSPNIWWPSDHAWCVVTDVDLDSTYVGATVEATDTILADERLESVSVQLTDEITQCLDGPWRLSVEEMATALRTDGSASMDTVLGRLDAKQYQRSDGLLEVTIVWERADGSGAGTGMSLVREDRPTDLVGVLEQRFVGLVLG